MTTVSYTLKSCIAGCLLVALAGCSAQYRTHGYTPSDSDLENVIIGVDTQETVSQSIGSPVSSGVLHGSDWYYVESHWRHFAWKAPKETDREVLAIRFDDEGVVRNVERFGLEDGQVVVLSRRVTDSNIKGIGFLRQLFGNFGNFTADQLLN